jgi:hypothetical protein
MASPAPTTPWPALHAAGVRHVVCLTAAKPGYDPRPLRLAHAVGLQDLVDGSGPREPVAEERLVWAAVEVVLDLLAAGEGVVVHCAGGTGRTGTVIGAVLRALGAPAETVLRDLDALHRARGARGWPESPWQAEVVARFPGRRGKPRGIARPCR